MLLVSLRILKYPDVTSHARERAKQDREEYWRRDLGPNPPRKLAWKTARSALGQYYHTSPYSYPET